MSMRFAILKKVTIDGKETIALEAVPETVLAILLGHVSNSLITTKKSFRGFSDKTILGFVQDAFEKTVSDFKKESVRL